MKEQRVAIVGAEWTGHAVAEDDGDQPRVACTGDYLVHIPKATLSVMGLRAAVNSGTPLCEHLRCQELFAPAYQRPPRPAPAGLGGHAAPP